MPNEDPRTRDDRVLLVESQEPLREKYAAALRDAGFAVLVAADAEQALPVARDDRLRAVVFGLDPADRSALFTLGQISLLQPAASLVILSETPDLPIIARAEQESHRFLLRSPPVADLVRAIEDSNEGPRRRPSLRVPPFSESSPLRVLLVESSDQDAERILGALAAIPGLFRPRRISAISDVRAAVAAEAFGVVLCALDLSDLQGLDAVLAVRQSAPDLPLIALSGAGDPEHSVLALQAGAQDYVLKSKLSASVLLRAIRYAVEQRRIEERLQVAASRDPLTGLANRALFRQRLDQALVRSRRDPSQFAVLCLDVDRFKAINDGLGHDAGDTFLCEVARRLEKTIREYDTVARFGSDEFAILLDRIDNALQAEVVAQRILTALSLPFFVGSTELVASASIGVAIYPDAGENSDSLFRAADAAMYFAKSKGRAHYEVYGSALDETAVRRLALEIQLRAAANAGEFRVHYQPQFNLRNSEVVGAEALLRWQDRQGNEVRPVEFVPILEDSGLIVQVGEWVLYQACVQLSKWRSAGYPIGRVSVNVSPRQFVHGGLVGQVREALARTGVSAAQLELEITEAVLLRNTDKTLQSLRELRAMGIRIAIDDFGTGYSSLAYLHQFPVTTLKLDRSFLEEIGVDERRSAVAGAIIHLSRRLDLEVVAEGVERATQRDFLRDEGCDLVQGTLFGSPCSARDFEQFWHESKISRRPAMAEIVSVRAGKR